jgi:hypothetical protein
VALAFSSALVVTGQVAIVEWNSSVGSDIYHAHKAAGAALLNGENPYSDAVRFLDGSPYAADDAVLEGYPYPPVVLVTFGLVAAFTDPRLVSMVAWFAILAWTAKSALFTRGQSDASLAIFLMLATLPGWPLIWFMSWTEPLSLVLFLAAALAWRRSALISGILLGLAVASKQYLVFLAPLLLLHRDENWVKRAGTAAATAAITLLPPILIDPSALYRSLIGNLAAIGFRPDSVSIVGLLNGFGIRFELPPWAWVLAAFAAGGLVSLGSRSWSTFLGRAGIILGVAFTIGLAFTNYWFFVMGLLAISAILDDRDRYIANPPT